MVPRVTARRQPSYSAAGTLRGAECRLRRATQRTPPATQPHPEGTGCRARGALAPRRAATGTFGSPTWHFPKVPSRSRGIPACRRVPVLWERRRRPRPVRTPTIPAFGPPRSLSRASERGLWGNANVGRILAGSRRWNPAMSSRTHSPATSLASRPATRVPGTAVFGCAEPCWDRPWQKVERPSTPTSGQKPRLRPASGRGVREPPPSHAGRPAGCQPHGRRLFPDAPLERRPQAG